VGYVQKSCYVETIRIGNSRTTPVGNRTARQEKTARQKILQSEKEAAAGRTISIPGSVQRNFESRKRAEHVRVQTAGRTCSSPGSGQDKLKSRQRAEKVRVQAAGRASSSPGRLAETRRRQRGPVHSVSSTQTSYNAK